MLKYLGCAAAALVAVAMLAGPAFAGIPTTVTVEGGLHSSGGGPVADGVYKLTFALYAAKTGGAAVWTEGPVPVQTAAGRFTHALGEVKALDATKLAAMSKQWLGIKVGDDPELTRTPLRSVVFALVAGHKPPSSAAAAAWRQGMSPTARSRRPKWASPTPRPTPRAAQRSRPRRWTARAASRPAT